MYVTVCVIVRENYVRKNINYDAYSLFRDYYCEKILPYHADRTMCYVVQVIGCGDYYCDMMRTVFSETIIAKKYYRITLTVLCGSGNRVW